MERPATIAETLRAACIRRLRGEFSAPPNGDQGSLDIGTFAGNLTITAGVNVRGDPGAINVGLRVGNNNYLFHPGFVTGQGAFRVDRADGFQNYEMGFTPLSWSGGGADVFHTLVVDITTDIVTSVDITVIDGLTGAVYQYDDPSDPWFGYRDLDYDPAGETVGLTVGGSSSWHALFDFVRIEDDAAEVPSPPTLFLLLLGLLGMLLTRKTSGWLGFWTPTRTKASS